MMYNVTIIIVSNIHESQTLFVGLISLAAAECVVSATTAERSSNEIKIAATDKKANM